MAVDNVENIELYDAAVLLLHEANCFEWRSSAVQSAELPEVCIGDICLARLRSCAGFT